MGFIDDFHNRHQTGGLQHLHADQIRAEVGVDRFQRFFKFAFVRNPFDRAVSQYVYMAQRPDLRRFLGMREGASFSRYLELIPRVKHVQWEPQRSFLVDPVTGDVLVDFIGRFERFASDARSVFQRLGVAADSVPHVNRSDRKPYREYYAGDDRAKVEAMYGSDLEFLGYNF